MRKVSSHPARLSLPFMDPFDGSRRARLRARRRRRARFSGPLSLRFLVSILVHGDVEHPVQAVLDAPVGADHGGEAVGAERRR